MIEDDRFSFKAQYCVQINDSIYCVAENHLVVTRYANLSKGQNKRMKTQLSEYAEDEESRLFASVINFQNKALILTGG